MTDAELRGFLLKIFHELRLNAGGRVPISDINLSGQAGVSREMIASACGHLADGGLIRWEPLTGEREGLAIGVGVITAHGVDVVDGLATATVAVSFRRTGAGAAREDNDHPLFGINPARIANWERYGVDAIEADLINNQGTAYVGGPPEVRDQARRWVQYKREQGRKKEPEVFTLKPSFFGFGVDLKAVGRRLRSWWSSSSK